MAFTPALGSATSVQFFVPMSAPRIRLSRNKAAWVEAISRSWTQLKSAAEGKIRERHGQRLTPASDGWTPGPNSLQQFPALPPLGLRARGTSHRMSILSCLEHGRLRHPYPQHPPAIWLTMGDERLYPLMRPFLFPSSNRPPNAGVQLCPSRGWSPLKNTSPFPSRAPMRNSAPLTGYG